MNIASLAQTLPIMLIGMVGIFLVIAVIILVVAVAVVLAAFYLKKRRASK